MSAPASTVYVYELPVRLWHGINALAIVVLALTGYLIAEPLASPAGEASEHFLMGYIRFAHFAAGYVVAVGFVGRVYWAYAGNEHARQIFMPPVWTTHFWGGVWHELRWYAFIAKAPRHYIGHNPLAILAMHLFVWGLLFMIVTGLALYGEGAGQQSWQFALFSSWVLAAFGDSQTVHTWHHLAMWFIVCFVLIHVYVAVREEKLSGQSMLSTIATGWRTFKDDKPVDDAH